MASRSDIRIQHVYPKSLLRYGEQLEFGWRAAGFSLDASLPAPQNVVVLEIHASAQEEIVSVPGGKVDIVLVHRPEEWILRYSEREREQQIGAARAIVLLGRSFVSEIQRFYPKLLVEAIPHGFFSFRVDSVFPVLGSVTT
jgi:hypothetical protein